MSEPTPENTPDQPTDDATMGCLSLTLITAGCIGGAIAVMYAVQWLTGF